MKEKITTTKLTEMKKAGEKIAALTCYDAPTAKMLDESGIDIALVGDSVGMVVLGYENTIPVTLEEMLYHTKAARRGLKRSLLVVDMPFLSYEADAREATRNAGRLIKEGGAEAVKLEGGLAVASIVKALVSANIPVMGHLGLTPQSIHKLGGYKVQGKAEESQEKILTDAKVLEAAGCFAIVLECIPESLGKRVTERLSIPTIGIGAGRFCDGQVLVFHDLLGMGSEDPPRFVKQYAHLYPMIQKAVSGFREDVKGGKFPSKEHGYT